MWRNGYFPGWRAAAAVVASSASGDSPDAIGANHRRPADTWHYLTDVWKVKIVCKLILTIGMVLLLSSSLGIACAGEEGPPGSIGAEGPQGPQGPQGTEGSTGIAGPQGTQGNQGVAGPAGASGKPAPLEQMRALEGKVARLEQTLSEQSTNGGAQSSGPVSAKPLVVAYSGDFPRLAADTVMPTGQSVTVDCQDPNATYPYSPYDWPDARATLEILQGVSSSRVTVEVSSARPKTHYTMWLRLRGEDASGKAYGGSPLTGIPGTPLIPTSELPNALNALTSPNAQGINGFHTDEDGNGSLTIDLDFPIVEGAYPFDRFEGFDAGDGRYPLESPSAHPVAIVGPGGPFTLRLASHCVDGLGHGLVPGPHEGWFDWKFIE